MQDHPAIPFAVHCAGLLQRPVAVEPLAPGCPWAELNHALGQPNLKWCEATQCSWITEPANTWSNLAYVAAALLMFHWARRDPRPSIRWMPAAVAFLAACSFAYHASSTFALQVFDFAGMFVFLFGPLVLNLIRGGVLPASRGAHAYGALVLAGLALVFAGRALGLPYQLLVAAGALITVGSELAMPRAERPPSYRDFAAAVGLLLLAGSCSALDLSRAWCDPDDHVLQGHAAWHVASAAALVFVFRHYAALQPGRAQQARSMPRD
ncbi:MAG TPA: ceramidase domain-containing protein [Myxococcales bacterium]|nr:ceramidase domain-containing protein [Myxococcales bacterium]